MIKKFHATNYMKGQINWQLPQLVNDGAIKFEKGSSRNKSIIIIDESKINPMNLKYIYSKLIPANREIRDWSSPLSIKIYKITCIKDTGKAKRLFLMDNYRLVTVGNF